MTIWWIFAVSFAAIGGYIIGIIRGHKTFEHSYEEGWTDAADFYESHFELTPIEQMLSDLEKDYKGPHESYLDEEWDDRIEKGKEFVRQLDEAFQDEDEVIDCGEY